MSARARGAREPAPAGRGPVPALRVATAASVLLLLGACGPTAVPPDPDPAAAGFDPVRLAAAAEALEAGTRVLLVRREGRVALEHYGGGHTPERLHHGASIAKAIAGLGLALLAAEGRVRPGDPAAQAATGWRSDARRARITLAQLASHTSGLPNRGPASWSERFWGRRGDPFSVALREVPLRAEPGSALHYSSPAIAVLELALASSLRGTGTPDLLLHLRQRLFRPCGIPDGELRFTYFGPAGLRRGGFRLHGMWGGLAATGRALGRLGELLASPAAARTCAGEVGAGLAAALRPASDHPLREGAGPGLLSGFGFWVNALGAWPGAPCDAALAYGAEDQLLLVVPELELVVVRLGEPWAEGGGLGPRAAGARVLGPLLAALERPPRPCRRIGDASRRRVGRPTPGLTGRGKRP